MKRNALKNGLALLGTVLVLGLGTEALAARGMGPGMGPRGGDCQGMDQRMGWRAGLSLEELEKVKAERQAFWTATADLRQQIHQKDLELAAELAKKAPDAGKARGLQKEVSDLQSQLDQQEIEHAIAIKKINPNAGLGMGGHRPMRRHHGGMERGMGQGMGMMMGDDCPKMNPPTPKLVN